MLSRHTLEKTGCFIIFAAFAAGDLFLSRHTPCFEIEKKKMVKKVKILLSQVCYKIKTENRHL